MSLRFETLTGGEIGRVIEGLAALRITVFRDWPYLYDGDLDYERRYLQGYAGNPRAIVVAAWAGERLVGASTGLPLTDADAEFAAAFADSPHDPAQVFYCAESVLLADCRGQGAGHHFFDAREDHARDLGYSMSAFCSVIRAPDHPARPATYRPLDDFWRKRGYAPLPGVIARFHWRDLAEADESEKTLQFWMRKL